MFYLESVLSFVHQTEYNNLYNKDNPSSKAFRKEFKAIKFC